MQELIHKNVLPKSLPYRASGSTPLILEAGAKTSHRELCNWIDGNAEIIERLLINHGAILFRGFDVDEAADFERIARAFDDQLQNEYLGTSPRDALTAYVFSASELPSFYPIPEHCEMSFIAKPPRRVFFCCLEEPALGSGETPLVDFRRVYRDLDPAVRARFDERGVRIVRNYRAPGARRPWEMAQLKSWDSMFMTTDRAVVETKCKEEGFEATWGKGDSLRLISRQPASKNHPVTGEPVWFNHSQVFHLSAAKGEYRRIFRLRPSVRHLGLLIFANIFVGAQRRLRGSEEQALHCTYGDGTEIPYDDMEAVRNAIWKNMRITPWKRGDVVAIDNDSTAHGRLPYRGPRRIAVAWA